MDAPPVGTLDDTIRLLERGCNRDELLSDLKRLKEFADTVNAVDEGLMAEQAMLLRQCRRALDDLLADRPILRAFSYGGQRGTTLGNLRSDLHAHRPQAIMGAQEK